jgi:HEAT repeat protein
MALVLAHRRDRLLRLSVLAPAVVALSLSFTAVAAADARTDFLIRMLATSAQFRVRTQAALALGGQAPAGSITQALAKALGDEHPAVRAASASSLGRLKDASAAPSLRAAQNDKDS